MRALTQRRLISVQLFCDSVAEKLERSNEDEHAEFVESLATQVREYVRDQRQGDRETVRFQHDE